MKKYKINSQIRASKVKVVDADSSFLGEKFLDEAVEIAKSKGLDLIEIANDGTMPICKILDFGKFKYREDKNDHKKEKTSKAQKLKEIKVSFQIGNNDLDLKSKKVLEFLVEGNNVRISLPLRGRENKHRDLAKSKLDSIIKLLSGYIKPGYELKFIGQGFSVDLRPDPEKIKKNYAKNKNKQISLKENQDNQKG